MTQELITLVIQAKLSGDTTWTTLQDVMRDTITVNEGFGSGAPFPRVAQTGIMTFELDNSAKNSAGLIGLYSPGHANCLVGWKEGIEIRLVVTSRDRSKTKFTGRIIADGISVSPYVTGSRRVRVIVHDWMEQASTHEMDLPTIQTTKRADEALTTILAGMDHQPASTDFDTGGETFTTVFDKIKKRGKALTQFSQLMTSEMGRLYLNHSTLYDDILVMENRTARTGATYAPVRWDINTNPYYLTRAGGGYLLRTDGSRILLNGQGTVDFYTPTFDANVTVDTKPTNGKYIYNSVKVRTQQRRIDTSNVVMWSQQTELELAAGGTITFRATYRDPTGGSNNVACSTGVAPAGTTDYTMFTATGGGGSNITASLAVTAGYYGNEAELTLVNSNAAKGYINFLQLRGKLIYFDNVAEYVSQDTLSQHMYGTFSTTIDATYQQDQDVAKAVAKSVRTIHKVNRPLLESVVYNANRSEQMANCYLDLEIGGKVAAEEPVSGNTGDYFINGVSTTFTASEDGGWIVDVLYYLQSDYFAVYDNTVASSYTYDEYAQIDTIIRSDTPDTNYNDIANGWGASSGVISVGPPVVYITVHGLIYFDMESIPSTGTISTAKINIGRLTASNNVSGTVVLNIYRLKKYWKELQVTYNERYSSVDWQTAGALGADDYDVSAPIATLNIADCVNADTDLTLSTTEMQKLINGTNQNFGFMFKVTPAGTGEFNTASVTAPTRDDPTYAIESARLIITYVDP